jgi:ABC-type uncharacterized transport system fused permease/ATPase subunit
MNRFDRAFWRRVWSLVRLYWFSLERGPGVRLLAWVVLLSAVALSVGAYGTYLHRDIANALAGKHVALFYRGMMFAAAAGGCAPSLRVA